MHRLIYLAAAGLLVSGCSAGDGEQASSAAATGSGSGSGVVADTYSSGFERAWERAGEGQSPSLACASVVGKAVGLLKTTATGGQERADALDAMDACYVRAMARFVDTTLSVENPGNAECIRLLTNVPTHRKSLGVIFHEVDEDVAAYDSRLNAQIEAKVRAACPGSADVILGS